MAQALQAGPRPKQRIHDGISRHRAGLVVDGFAEEVLAGLFRRAKIPAHQGGGQAAVHLLRERRAHIVGAQPSFHMPDRDVRIERGQGRTQDRRRVALHQDRVGAGHSNPGVDGREDAGGEVSQALARLHEVQVDIGAEAKDRQGLIQHLAMLGGDNEHGANGLRLQQLKIERSHLDAFGTGADNQGDGAHEV